MWEHIKIIVCSGEDQALSCDLEFVLQGYRLLFEPYQKVLEVLHFPDIQGPKQLLLHDDQWERRVYIGLQAFRQREVILVHWNQDGVPRGKACWWLPRRIQCLHLGIYYVGQSEIWDDQASLNLPDGDLRDWWFYDNNSADHDDSSVTAAVHHLLYHSHKKYLQILALNWK